MGALAHLLPPRSAGASALLSAAPEADVVLGWHVGFEGLDTFGGIIDVIGSGRRHALMRFERVDRTEVPSGADFGLWLDSQWLALDKSVDDALVRDAATPMPKRHL